MKLNIKRLEMLAALALALAAFFVVLKVVFL